MMDIKKLSQKSQLASEPDLIRDVLDDLELTGDEMAQVKGVVTHPGWDVIVKKVWGREAIRHLLVCRKVAGTPEAVRHSGIYEGIQLCSRVARKAAFPEERTRQPSTQKEKIHRNFSGDSFRGRTGSSPI